MSHLPSVLASRSNTHPFLLRVNRMRVPSGENRGNQSTVSPCVIGWMFEPSVFITNRSWLPRRELDQTMIPFALPPISSINLLDSSSGFSSLPLGEPLPAVAQPPSATAASAATWRRDRRRESVNEAPARAPA